MSAETLQRPHVSFELGAVADGAIEPAARSLEQEKLTQIERDVLSERFDARVTPDNFMPCGCIDGRCFHNGSPNAAGGTLTPFVGELLTNLANVDPDAPNSDEMLKSFITHLRNINQPVGGHGDNHADAEKSGCGANDKLALIIAQIANKPDAIQAALETVGVAVDQESFDRIVHNATVLAEKPEFFSSGAQVGSTLQAEAEEANFPILQDSHNEVLVRINTVEGTTLDRNALAAEYGNEYQVFNVDAWAIQKAAETLSSSEEEAREKNLAMLMYQVATALQLCGPSMRVIVR